MKQLLLAVLIASFYTTSAQNYELTINIPNLKSVTGKIHVGIYNNERSFPKLKKQYKVQIFNVTKMANSYIINNLPKGEYAVAVFHDKNEDDICNTNLFGIPKEGYGFSKNFKPKLSAPKFEDCNIYINKDTEILIDMIY